MQVLFMFLIANTPVQAQRNGRMLLYSLSLGIDNNRCVFLIWTVKNGGYEMMGIAATSFLGLLWNFSLRFIFMKSNEQNTTS